MYFSFDEVGIDNRPLVNFKGLSLNDYKIEENSTRYNERFRVVTRTFNLELKDEVYAEFEEMGKSELWNKHYRISYDKHFFNINVFYREEVSFRGCKTDASMDKKINKIMEKVKGETITAEIDQMVDTKLKNINDSINETLRRYNNKVIELVETHLYTGSYNENIDKHLDQKADIDRKNYLEAEISAMIKEKNALDDKIFKNRVKYFKDAYMSDSKEPNQTLLEKLDTLKIKRKGFLGF